MILPIYLYGQPVLRKVAEDIIPDYATLSFDIRTTNINNYNEVVSLVENKIKELENEYKTTI